MLPVLCVFFAFFCWCLFAIFLLGKSRLTGGIATTCNLCMPLLFWLLLRLFVQLATYVNFFSHSFHSPSPRQKKAQTQKPSARAHGQPSCSLSLTFFSRCCGKVYGVMPLFFCTFCLPLLCLHCTAL